MKKSLRKRLKRTIRNHYVGRISGLGLSVLVRSLMGTLEYKTVYAAETDPAIHDLATRYIYVFWHEYIPYQLYLRGNCDVCFLLSQNADAEMLEHAAGYMGFQTVRGSSYSNGVSALRGLLRVGRHQHLAIATDGPRGPRRQMSIGPIYLSSRLGNPIVPLGMGYDAPWRLSSWDRFAIPRPFTRARCLMGEPIRVPENATESEMEDFRMAVQETLNQLTVDAERWAQSGQPMPDQVRTIRMARFKSPKRTPRIVPNSSDEQRRAA